MACTLEELHNAHYEMLYKFDEYCKKNSIGYSLHWGTLLGAVRHDGIIPWDDDVDIVMDIKSFNKMSKQLKKEPIDGLFFQWINTERKYPYLCAKLRKNDSLMTEWPYYKLGINQGILIDIFVYIDKPKKEFGIKYQELLLKSFYFLGKFLIFKVDASTIGSTKHNFSFYKFIPNFLIIVMRKILFSLISHTGASASECVRYFGFSCEQNFKIPRDYFEPRILHKFGKFELYIPKNYDKLLRTVYGENYMTPIKYDNHVNLDNVIINTKQ